MDVICMFLIEVIYMSVMPFVPHSALDVHLHVFYVSKAFKTRLFKIKEDGDLIQDRPS